MKKTIISKKQDAIPLELLDRIKDNYTPYRNLFIAHQKQIGKTTFSYKDILDYYSYLKEKGLKASTINTTMAALKKTVREITKNETDIIKLFYLEKKLKELPKEQIQSKAVDCDTDKIPTEEEINVLLEKGSYKLGLFIRFLIHTGARIFEVTQIKHSMITEKEKLLEIRIVGKGSKERILKVDKELVKEIQAHFQGKTYLFETSGGKQYRKNYVSYQIQRLSMRVLSKRFSAHSFRHYFATTMLKKSGDVKAVSNYLGHSKISITLDMYIHSILSFEQLQKMLFDASVR